MRIHSFVAAAALALATLAAHADSIAENFSISNVVANQDVSLNYGANANFFSQFNPSSGTLTSITLSLTGTATNTFNGFGLDQFIRVGPAPAPQRGLSFSTQGSRLFGGSFPFSASGQDSSSFDLAYFEGTGTQALRLEFSQPTTVNSASGTLTYNYTPTATPPAAVTPEPSSLVLLGTGLLGLAGVLRRRFTSRC